MIRPTRREILGFGGAALVAGLAPARAQTRGKLAPFYRSAQLQGTIPGHGLMACPNYLKTPGDYLFRRVSPGRTAVPFTDSFSITRFLGGNREDWLRQFSELDPRLGRASLDYAVEENGHLRTRADIVKGHLEPYLKAGYTAGDITIVLDNTPWALARDGGASGPFGQNDPPADIAAWGRMLRQLCRDIKEIVGAGTPNFKVGNEYDTKKSFQGGPADYFALYEASYKILREAFPACEIAPGEFTRDGHCAGGDVCVYDTGDFLRRMRAGGMAPSYVPRSLNAFLDAPGPAPSQAVRRAVNSYRGLGSVTAEIHQFGLLGQTFGPLSSFGSDIGPRRAAWEFSALMRLREELAPRRVFHWDTFFDFAGTRFAMLNGVGFVRMLLDQYLGAEVELAPVTASYRGEVEVTAAIFQSGATVALALASFCPGEAAPGRVELRLPGAKARDWRFVRTGADIDVFAAMKDDLRQAGNLKREFTGNSAVAEPPHMAVDANAGRRLLLERRLRYEAIISEALQWRPASALPYGLRQTGGALSVDLPANEILVLEAAV